MYASIFREGIFDGRTIVISGGGSGIGRCTAHELDSLGAKILMTGRNAEKFEWTAAEIRQDGGTAAHSVFDIRDEERVRSTVADMLADHGVIYGLVNNAGGQYPMPLESIGKKGWEAVLATNLSGGFLVAREVYTQMHEVQRRRNREHDCKYVGRHNSDLPLRCRPGRDDELHEDGCAGMGIVGCTRRSTSQHSQLGRRSSTPRSS
jgi:NAD(P)-dependent dehydrogenase (short-subunit alcohol dehydrogenase family)